MKRKSDLYQNICDFNAIVKAFDTVCKNTKNKRKVDNFQTYKCMYISQIYKMLNEKSYQLGNYHIFKIYEPKERIIVSLNMIDKVVNNLVSKYILEPSILPCLIDSNVASRKNMGTKKGLKLRYCFEAKLKKDYFILKCDISKFFASIDINLLKKKIETKIKDKDALTIINTILDSYDKGLCIGLNTSQVLAVFYLNDLDHYIKEKLKIKCYVRFQDDFLLFHKDKVYLKFCFNKIKEFLLKENLKLNSKSRIYKWTDNYAFLGRNKFNGYTKYRKISKNIKKRYCLYQHNVITLYSYLSSIICYDNLNNQNVY